MWQTCKINAIYSNLCSVNWVSLFDGKPHLKHIIALSSKTTILRVNPEQNGSWKGNTSDLQLAAWGVGILEFKERASIKWFPSALALFIYLQQVCVLDPWCHRPRRSQSRSRSRSRSRSSRSPSRRSTLELLHSSASAALTQFLPLNCHRKWFQEVRISSDHLLMRWWFNVFTINARIRRYIVFQQKDSSEDLFWGHSTEQWTKTGWVGGALPHACYLCYLSMHSSANIRNMEVPAHWWTMWNQIPTSYQPRSINPSWS